MKVNVGRLATTRESKIGRLRLVEVENNEGSNISFYRCDNDDVYMTRNQIGKALGYGNPQRAISTIFIRNKWVLDRLKKEVKMQSEDGKFYKTQLFGKEGIKFIANYSRRPTGNKITLFEYLGINHDLQEPPRKEVEYIHSLMKIFRMFEVSTEKVVGEYRVDMTFDELMIAIECDEFGHKNYKPEDESRRERFLKDCGYRVYRFNPDEDDFCFDTVVGDILNIVIEIKEEGK